MRNILNKIVQKEEKTKDFSSIFNESLKELDEKATYESLETLYYNIKEYYSIRIINNDINIDVERAAIETKIGKYSGKAFEFKAAYFISLFSAIFTVFIDKAGVFDTTIKIGSATISNILTSIFRAMVYFILIIVLFRTFGSREETIEKRKMVVYNMRLKVLDNIEKELKEKNANTTISEVAATVQEEQSKNQLRPISQQANGNWNVEIKMPSIIDTVASVYKIGKFMRKIFSRKK